ncbi:MAG: AbrB/MazE/SpoVT family DNA-binding domain-containing protein [Acidobacteria bacterium]|nr:AbrB/MazE/SpoVT family DNA-binding domain-containing protein [Acidobacteriota bacterium]
MEATIDRFGRILIPKSLRDDLGVEPGTVFEIELSDGAVQLRPLLEEPELVNERGLLVHRGKPVGDVENTLQRVREERIRKFFPENWSG